MTEPKTLPQATPSEPGMAKPLVRHLVAKAPDPDNPGQWLPDMLADTTLCGELWDRVLDITGLKAPTCGKCLFEAAMNMRGRPQ